MKELNVIIKTKSKIVSINSLYGVKIAYNAGRPYPQMYRSASAMAFEREIRDQLLALKLGQDWIDFFRNTRSFSMTVNFILRTGISRRDVSNMDKALIDTVTRFIHDDLGVDTFDDSLFADVHFYKSLLKSGANEYCCIQIKESTHNLSFGVTPKPDKVWFSGGEFEISKPKRKKKDVHYIETVTDKDDADTWVYIITPETKIEPSLYIDITKTIDKINYLESGFVYVVLKDVDEFPGFENIRAEIDKLGTHGKIEKLDNLSDVLKWLD